jgi:hypothetical protein
LDISWTGLFTLLWEAVQENAMLGILLRYATPFITGLFVVSLVSGVALFFHVGQSYFRGMHEWLSMVLIAPFVFHLVKNWRPFLAYFKRSPMMIALAVSIVAAGIYAWQGATAAGGGNPAIALANAVQTSALSTVAPVFGHTPESLTTALTEKGYTIAGADSKLGDIAKASGKEGFDLIRDIAALKK